MLRYFNSELKGLYSVNVLSKDHSLAEWRFRFTTVPFKPLISDLQQYPLNLWFPIHNSTLQTFGFRFTTVPFKPLVYDSQQYPSNLWFPIHKSTLQTFGFRFTTVPFKPLTDQGERHCSYLPTVTFSSSFIFKKY